MSEHKEAIEMIRNTELSDDTKMDLYEIYLEDVEEYSLDTALEKLEVGSWNKGRILMSRKFNTICSPADELYAIQNMSDHDKSDAEYLVTWRREKVMRGVSVRFGGMVPLAALLEEAGYTRYQEADPENDEFECEDCHGIFDIDDSIKKGHGYYCPKCVGENW